jgi:hypothetical protein
MESDDVRLVKMTWTLMQEILSRDAQGYLVTWEWGEPDAQGFYVPMLTHHEDDRLGVLDEAWDEAEAALALDPRLYLAMLHLSDDEDRGSEWEAIAWDGDNDDPWRVYGTGLTPAAALKALTDTLRRRA